MCSHRIRILSVLTAIVVASISASVNAQSKTPEFRIESQVYVGDTQTPVSQNVTLFVEGVVYDFQTSGGANASATEIVMFDERKRELILLDVGRKLSWTVADLRLLKMVDQLRRETVNNPKASFLVNQPFTETHDWSSDTVSVESESIRYLLRGQRPTEESILPRYFDFLDQMTRLTASDPKRLPPFARLTLNKTIKSLGWIPSEVKVSFQPNEFFKQSFEASSKHVLVMSLSNADRQRIEFARKCWFEFTSCSLTEYRQISSSSKQLAQRPHSNQSKKNGVTRR